MNRGIPAAASTLAEILTIASQQHAETGVVDGDGSFRSWVDVEQHSRRIAGGLAAAGIGPGDRVAVVMFKSTRSFIAVHGVLRAGATVVPVDPMTTKPYVTSVLHATSPTAVLGDEPALSRLVKPALVSTDAPLISPPAVLVTTGDTDAVEAWTPPGCDVCGFDTFGQQETGRALPRITPEDDAYILFTSGSTGHPKGMLHSHHSALAYITAAVGVHALTPRSRLAGTAPLHFDMSTLELFSVPLAGGTAITVTEAEKRFPASLSEKLEREHVTHMYAVPFLLRQLDEHGALDQRDLSQLIHIAFAGEPMSASLLAALMQRQPDATFVNAYGPAETNVVTSRKFSGDPWTSDTVPIGAALPGVRVRIVDDNDAPVEPGSTGELLVAAPSCMREYWNDPAETNARLFYDGPDRWYRTGDLVFDDGIDLQFVGRVDNQVKIRGVRIELEAIEATLHAEPSVAHSVVLKTVDDDGDEQLQAFVVTAGDAVFDERALRLWCTARLTAAAVPGRFHHVPSLPVSTNGKIDRNAFKQSLTEPHSHGT